MQELKDQLVALETQRIAIEAALVAAEMEHKAALVDTIRDMIQADGFDLDEIASMLPRKPAKTSTSKGNGASRKASDTRWALKDDPTQTYTRGPTPRWMRQAIESSGMDRKTFMAERMAQV